PAHHWITSSPFHHRSTHPRDLHSFPTRRSSDLNTALDAGNLHSGNLPGIHALLNLFDSVFDVLKPTETAGGLSESAIDELIAARDRKSTRLNSSHLVISYAVFCLKKKKAESRDP